MEVTPLDHRAGLGDGRGGRRSGRGDGDEWRAAAGGDKQGLSEAAVESASWSDPESERMTEKWSLSEPSGEVQREGPVVGVVNGSGSGDRARGAAAGGTGPGSAGAGPGRRRRSRRARLGPVGSPAGLAGRRDE